MRTGVGSGRPTPSPTPRSASWNGRWAGGPIQVGDPARGYAYLTTLGIRRPARRPLHLPVRRHRHARLGLRARRRAPGWPTSSPSGSGCRWAPSTTPRSPVTPSGRAIHDGGISADARDLARFGQLLLDDGAVGTTQVVPRSGWTTRCTPDPDVRAAFASSENEPVLPGGWYRNQFWFVPGSTAPYACAWGSTARWCYVDRATRTVGRQALVLARGPEPRLPHRHGARLRRGRREGSAVAVRAPPDGGPSPSTDGSA